MDKRLSRQEQAFQALLLDEEGSGSRFNKGPKKKGKNVKPKSDNRRGFKLKEETKGTNASGMQQLLDIFGETFDKQTISDVFMASESTEAATEALLAMSSISQAEGRVAVTTSPSEGSTSTAADNTEGNLDILVATIFPFKPLTSNVHLRAWRMS